MRSLMPKPSPFCFFTSRFRFSPMPCSKIQSINDAGKQIGIAVASSLARLVGKIVGSGEESPTRYIRPQPQTSYSAPVLRPYQKNYIFKLAAPPRILLGRIYYRQTQLPSARSRQLIVNCASPLKFKTNVFDRHLYVSTLIVRPNFHTHCLLPLLAKTPAA
ncbi:hypothetical protein KCP75_00135 [Salmonella enterica subsp. enterica]|nr:hypothetical protein KCP75_00135 [Salmonella enterica subsp. enterica]